MSHRSKAIEDNKATERTGALVRLLAWMLLPVLREARRREKPNFAGVILNVIAITGVVVDVIGLPAAKASITAMPKFS